MVRKSSTIDSFVDHYLSLYICIYFLKSVDIIYYNILPDVYINLVAYRYEPNTIDLSDHGELE